MLTVREPAALPPELRRAPHAGAGVAFVPTMGALHEGHAALVRRAAALGRPVVVSVFVNPTQFEPGTDLDRYPRTPERDDQVARSAGADIVFAPRAEDVYPPGVEIPVPPLPAVATEPGLEDAFRPGHLAGVCQVVARLFDLVAPSVAVFGEKDFQQLLVIEAMVEETARRQPRRWPGLRVERHPTVREPGGLACSSRNAYLEPPQRGAALGVVRALRAADAAGSVEEAERLMRLTLQAHGLEAQYAVVRDARSLQPLTGKGQPARALIAARAGAVRLIDNCALWESVGPAPRAARARHGGNGP
jgi:pantoate--beta-alanine ligase